MTTHRDPEQRLPEDSDQVDPYLRLALEEPDLILLRAYFEAVQAGVPMQALSESEERWVVTNLNFNPPWQEAWGSLEDEVGQTVPWPMLRVDGTPEPPKKTPPPEAPPARKSRLTFLRRRRTLWMAAAVVVLYGVLWQGGRQLTGDTFEAASLQGQEASLLSAVRSSERRGDTAFIEGATALLDAPTSVLGLFPRYSQERATTAARELERAFLALTDPFQRAETAFYIAKAHLMLGDPDTARRWLQTADEQGVVDFQDDIARVLSALEAL